MKKSFLILFFLLSGWSAIWAQSLSPSVIASAGGYISNSTHSLSWTLGEIAITTITGSGYTLNQGFQQALVIGTAVEDNPLINWSIQTYPNPVNDILRIRFSLENTASFLVELLDMTGKKMVIRTLENVSHGDEVDLDMSHLAAGIYIIKVQSDDMKISSTVRIQKY